MLNDSEQPFDLALEVFDDASRQNRLEASELHHDRAPLVGVVRELEAQPAIDALFSGRPEARVVRFRQAIGVLVRMIMEGRGWRRTGRKGSMWVRETRAGISSTRHNTSGLAFWFVRAERYELEEGMPFQSVRERCRKNPPVASRKPQN